MQVARNWLALIAAVLFAVAFFGATGWLDDTPKINVEAWKDAGLVFLALSFVVVFPRGDHYRGG